VFERFGEFRLCDVVGGWVGQWDEAVWRYHFIVKRFLIKIAKSL
jgi:hypothetical protein